jgi:tetratricopeptide (TPR) repeat protein
MATADRQPGEEPRYRLLETVRQYAREKLEDSGDSARLHARHRDYFLSFAETNFPRLQTAERPIWLKRLEAESDNLRLALEWSFSDFSNPEAGPRLLMELLGGYAYAIPEMIEWGNRAVAWCESHPGISDRLYARLLEMAPVNNQQTGIARLKKSIEISRRLGPAGNETLMWSLKALANHYQNGSEDVEQALAPFAEAEAILHSLAPEHYAPDEYLRVKAFFAAQKSDLLNMLGRYEEAKAPARESIRLCEESGSPWLGFMGQGSLAYACVHLGEYDQARQHVLNSLALGRGGGDDLEQSFSPYAIHLLAIIEFSQDNLERALEFVDQGIRQAQKIPDLETVARFLAIRAAICVKYQQPTRAARFSGASRAMLARQGRGPWSHYRLDSILPGWRDGPDQAAIQQAFDEGQAMNSDQAVAYALADA